MNTTARSSRIGRVALTTILVISTTTLVAAAESDPVGVAELAEGPAVEVVPHTQKQYERGMIEWARDLFDQADLDLPYVSIRFSAHIEDCEGKLGTLRTTSRGARIVRICADHGKPAARDRLQRRNLVHELAHLWEQTNVDDETRREFMAFRDLDHWNDRTDDWYRRATEHAAETITWGLIDFPWLFVAIPDNSCAEMLAGFRILTGRDPINGQSEAVIDSIAGRVSLVEPCP